MSGKKTPSDIGKDRQDQARKAGGSKLKGAKDTGNKLK